MEKFKAPLFPGPRGAGDTNDWTRVHKLHITVSWWQHICAHFLKNVVHLRIQLSQVNVFILRTQFLQVNVTFAHIIFSLINGMFTLTRVYMYRQANPVSKSKLYIFIIHFIRQVAFNAQPVVNI